MDRLSLMKALADDSRYAIFLEVSRSSGPLSTLELAERLDLHPNTVRLHLERLREVGLVEVSTLGHGSVGRPQHRWTPSVNAPSLGLEPSGFRVLAHLLAEAAAAGLPEAAVLHDIGRRAGLARPGASARPGGLARPVGRERPAPVERQPLASPPAGRETGTPAAAAPSGVAVAGSGVAGGGSGVAVAGSGVAGGGSGVAVAGSGVGRAGSSLSGDAGPSSSGGARGAVASCLDAVVGELADLGFDPVIDGAASSGSGAVIGAVAFTSCPFRELAAAYPDLVCALHRGVTEGIVAGTSARFAGVSAELAGFSSLVDPDPCRAELAITAVG